MEEKTLGIMLIINLIIVLVSPMIIPSIANNQLEINYIKFGFPYPFIEQRSTLTPHKEMFPFWLTQQNPWENPTRSIYVNFFLSYAVVAVFIFIIYKFCIWRFYS